MAGGAQGFVIFDSVVVSPVFSLALRISRNTTLPELNNTQPPIDDTMITVPLDGSAADSVAGNRHKETKAKKKSERMELLGRSRTCKRPEDGAAT
jgi:hypothetical protein